MLGTSRYFLHQASIGVKVKYLQVTNEGDTLMIEDRQKTISVQWKVFRYFVFM